MEGRIEGRIDENKLRWKKEAFLLELDRCIVVSVVQGKGLMGYAKMAGYRRTDGQTITVPARQLLNRLDRPELQASGWILSNP